MYTSRVPSTLLDQNISNPKTNLSFKNMATIWYFKARSVLTTGTPDIIMVEEHAYGLCVDAAISGHRTLLQYLVNEMLLKRRLLPFIAAGIYAAVTAIGDLKCLRWLHQKLIFVDLISAQFAAETGDRRILEWLDTGIILGYRAYSMWVDSLIKYNHLDLMDWAFERGFIRKPKFMTKYLNALTSQGYQWYVQRFGQPSPDLIDYIRSRAAETFQTDLLHYLNDLKKPYPARYLVHNISVRGALSTTSTSNIDAGALIGLCIDWGDMCICDVQLWPLPDIRVAEALLYFLIRLGIPTSCPSHEEISVGSIRGLVLECTKMGTNSLRVPIAMEKGDLEKTAITEDEADIDAINVLSRRVLNGKTIVQPYEPVSTYATNEELVEIINEYINPLVSTRHELPPTEINLTDDPPQNITGA